MEGYVFTGVCLFTVGGIWSQIVFDRGYLGTRSFPEGRVFWKDYPLKVLPTPYTTWKDYPLEELPPPQGLTPWKDYPQEGQRDTASRWYASYWNAFLFSYAMDVQ